uniref:Radial spoke head protein 4 homolog A n=1 Tax=Trichobilharzia regenti TaxID=157069 RepID=A0AA85JFR0_TRIRE|nr:unnamed protein product [Trichobilharzia regenti]
MAEPRQTYVNLGPELPAENEFLRGKALLQSMHSSCGAGGGGIGGPKLHDENRQSDPRTGNLYEHLVTLLKLILETQPTHALDQFEMLSYQVKRERGGGTGGSGAGAGLVQEDTEARAPTEEPVSADYKHVKIEGTLLKHPKHKWDEPPYSKSALPTNWGGIFDNEDEIQRLQNLGITSFLIEQGGIGLGRTEMLRVWLSIRKLSLKLKTIVKLRFWGKIMGTESSYYIAEGEFEAEMPPDDGVPAPYDDWRPYEHKTEENPSMIHKESTYEEETEKEPSPTNELPEEQMKLNEARKIFLQDLPKNKWCPLAPIPPEPRGRGLNRWDYFACTNLGSDEWFRLPPVRAEHIFYARNIRRLFTGRPDAPVQQGPGELGEFHGLEVHLLRAQIARITSACWVAPAGIYEIDEEAELEEGEQPETLMEVEEFEPPEFEELLDRNNWLHIRPYILPQGRCSFISQKQAASTLKDVLDNITSKNDTNKEIGWFHPTVIEKWTERFKAQEEKADEELEEEEEEAGGGAGAEEPQEGPGLLGTIEEDAVLIPVGDIGLPTGRANRSKSRSITLTSRPLIAWRVKPSSVLLPKNCCVAIVSSGRWPGAYSLGRGGDFVNVYVGWGQKVLSASFSPLRIPKLMSEYNEEEQPTGGGSLSETNDPTPLEEEALRELKEARRLAREAKAEEEEENEGGEEGEEDEDED